MNFLSRLGQFIRQVFAPECSKYSVELTAEYECTLLIEAESEEHARASVHEALFDHMKEFVTPDGSWELTSFVDMRVTSCKRMDEPPE